jgi:hypothetical protein
MSAATRHSLRRWSGLLATALLCACAQHGSGFLPAGNPSAASVLVGAPPRSVVLPEAVPPSCKGQKTTKKFASLTETLRTQGGKLCIPAFGGFGGTIEYPSADPSVKMKLTSSTSDYDKMPALGPGKPIFYLQLAISGGTYFGTNVPAGGGLAAKKIVPGDSYTAFGEATIYGFTVKFTPCYIVAKKSSYGGVIGGIGSLLKGQDVPAAATGLIEIYPGKHAGGKC